MKIKFPYRNEHNQRFTRQLFYEQWINLPIDNRLGEPPFTLHTDKEGYINFGKAYVEDGDPSGYKTAMRLLGDYDYWKFLMKVAWFREAKAEWDETLDAKLSGEGMAKIREIANSEDRGALAAAKFLATLEYRKEKAEAKRGRPSKDELEGKLNEMAAEERELEEHAKRIRLVK